MNEEKPEDNVIVISNGEAIYVYRPEDSEELGKVYDRNHIVTKLKSFLRPVSSSLNIFDTSIDGYIPEKADRLWINPEGAGVHVPKGMLGRLNNPIPARIKTEAEEFETVVDFKYHLSIKGTVNTVICSEKRDRKRAELVEEDVTLDLKQEMIEETFDAQNPLKP